MGPLRERRMPRADTPASRRPHAECRHRSQIPRPAGEDLAQPLGALRRPSVLAPRPLARRAPGPPPRVMRMRPRLLPRSVMVASVVSLGWRRRPAGTEVPRVLAGDGVLGVRPGRVRRPALTTRLEVLPAAVMGQRWAEGCARVRAQGPPARPQPAGAPGQAACSLLAMVAGSTRAARRHKTPGWRARQGLVLGGKRLVRVEAFSHRPRWPRSTDAAAANDPRVTADSMAALPIGGRWVCDLGFCSVLWCADLPDQQKCWVTRMRATTASRPGPVRRQGPDERDASIPVGQDRAHPCTPPRRMVSLRGPGVW